MRVLPPIFYRTSLRHTKPTSRLFTRTTKKVADEFTRATEHYGSPEKDALM
jgi:hypothetical protein